MNSIKFGALAILATLSTHSLAAGDTANVEYLTTDVASEKRLPFSEAVRVGDILYLSGKIGTMPETGKLAEGGIKGEAKQTMENIKATLAKHNLTMNNLVKCTVMLADISEWATFNEVYVTFFDGRFPARSAFGASGLALGSRVEVECIAHIG